MCWIDRDARRTKCPINSALRLECVCDRSADLRTFAEAHAPRKRSDTYAGFEFVFSPDDPFCGLDLDEGGELLWGAVWCSTIAIEIT